MSHSDLCAAGTGNGRRRDDADQASGSAARGIDRHFINPFSPPAASRGISPAGRRTHTGGLRNGTAVALLLLVVGTILFHFLSPWWFTPIASNWKMMDDTVNITFVVTGIVFVAVNLFMAWAVFLYRHRQGQKG